MSMNPVPKKQDLETTNLIEQFLKNGGSVSVMPPFQTSENIKYTKGVYGKRPKNTTKTTEQTIIDIDDDL